MTSLWHKSLDTVKLSGFNRSLRILFVVLVGILVIIFYYLYKAIWPTPYLAKQEGFQIAFNQTPTVNVLAPQKVSGEEETGKIYSVQNQNKGTAYIVSVTNYPDTNFSSLSKASTISTLQNEIEELAKNDQTNLSNGQDLTFNGLNAVQATLTPADRSEKSSEVLAFLNKNRLYVIFGTGISQSKFDSFTATFHFIN